MLLNLKKWLSNHTQSLFSWDFSFSIFCSFFKGSPFHSPFLFYSFLITFQQVQEGSKYGKQASHTRADFIWEWMHPQSEFYSEFSEKNPVLCLYNFFLAKESLTNGSRSYFNCLQITQWTFVIYLLYRSLFLHQPPALFLSRSVCLCIALLEQHLHLIMCSSIILNSVYHRKTKVSRIAVQFSVGMGKKRRKKRGEKKGKIFPHLVELKWVVWVWVLPSPPSKKILGKRAPCTSGRPQASMELQVPRKQQGAKGRLAFPFWTFKI